MFLNPNKVAQTFSRSTSSHVSRFAAFEQLETRDVFAGLPELVSDLNPTLAPIGFTSGAVLGDSFLFARTSEQSGNSLWKSDGTPSGSQLVKEKLSISGSLTTVGDHVYFMAINANSQKTLWKSDGTEAGTQLVHVLQSADIEGMGGSGNQLYFYDRNSEGTVELWRSDGTQAGTQFLSTRFSLPTEANDTLYFINIDSFDNELWVGDGTDAGTRLLKEINPTGSSSAQGFTNVNGTLYFTANDGTSGPELWKSDGTESGTVLVRDIEPDNSNYAPRPFGLVAAGNTLFFYSSNTLWKSDGTAIGTIPLSQEALSPRYLTNVSGTLYFQGTSQASGTELWKSDGTVEGTVPLLDLEPTGSSYPRVLTNVNGQLFFNATLNGQQDLWKSDGTADGTSRVAGNGRFYIEQAFATEQRLIFSHQFAFWASDGTDSGTFAISDGSTLSSNPDAYIEFKGNLFFTANDGRSFGIWKTDGTRQGSQLIKGGFLSPLTSIVRQGDFLLFYGSDLENGLALWRTDGTSGGTELLIDTQPGPANSFGAISASLGGLTYFNADNQLWKTDGTMEGTLRANAFPEVMTPVKAGGSLYWFIGNQLWKSDGTENGNVFVRDIGRSFVRQITSINDTLFFVTSNNAEQQVWKSDGTADGTIAISSHNFPESPELQQAVIANGVLYFVTRSVFGTDVKLWRSDGTPDGTSVIEFLNPFADPFEPSQDLGQFVDLNGSIYFRMGNESKGYRLWKTDGTSAGTQVVLNPHTNEPILGVKNLQVIRGNLYFVDDTQLWTIRGTAQVPESLGGLKLERSAFSSTPFAALANKLYFAAYDPTHGTELWSIEMDADPDDLNQDGSIDLQDMNLFCAAVQSGSATPQALSDFWDRQDTGPGDANFDRLFDSADLIAAFQHGTYETGSLASWESGDWDCDGLFSSNDLIVAFQRGWYRST